MELGIGTAQFGLDYGISNKEGKARLSEVEAILEFSEKIGIRYIDTARKYGDSEKILGKYLSNSSPFRIVTKVLPVESLADSKSIDKIVPRLFHESLVDLNSDHVYGLLVHQPEDLLLSGSELLWNTLAELKKEGEVKKIGASVYNEDQIWKILDKFPVDIFQIPINVLDQRLVESGCLKKLKKRNIEIHARSIFLQGLVLMDYENLPGYFAEFENELKKYFGDIEKHQYNKVELAVNFVKNVSEIDVAIFGVENREQLQEIHSFFEAGELMDLDFTKYSCENIQLLNPSLWELYGS